MELPDVLELKRDFDNHPYCIKAHPAKLPQGTPGFWSATVYDGETGEVVYKGDRVNAYPSMAIVFTWFDFESWASDKRTS